MRIIGITCTNACLFEQAAAQFDLAAQIKAILAQIDGHFAANRLGEFGPLGNAIFGVVYIE